MIVILMETHINKIKYYHSNNIQNQHQQIIISLDNLIIHNLLWLLAIKIKVKYRGTMIIIMIKIKIRIKIS